MASSTPPRAFLYIQPPHTATGTVKEWLQNDVPEMRKPTNRLPKDAGLLLPSSTLDSPESLLTPSLARFAAGRATLVALGGAGRRRRVREATGETGSSGSDSDSSEDGEVGAGAGGACFFFFPLPVAL